MIVKRADFVRAIEAGIAGVQSVRTHNFEAADFDALRRLGQSAASSCAGLFRVNGGNACPLTQVGIADATPYKVGQAYFWTAYDAAIARAFGGFHMGAFAIED